MLATLQQCGSIEEQTSMRHLNLVLVVYIFVGSLVCF